MNEGSPFSFTRLSRKQKNLPVDIDLVLNLVPHPALVIDADSLAILSANQAACELFGYSDQELTKLDASKLFENWSIFQAEQRQFLLDSSNSTRLTLRRKEKIQQEVLLKQWALSNDQKRLFILINEILPGASGIPYISFIDGVTQALQQPILTDALSTILTVFQSQIKIDCLAIYLANAQKPQLVCEARRGKTEWLPETLPAQELVTYKNPQLWQAGKRVSSTLSRAAQSNKIPCIVIVPLSAETLPTQAVSGLLVLADSEYSSGKVLLDIGPVIAGLLIALIQAISRLNQSEILSTQLELAREFQKTIFNNTEQGCLILTSDLSIIDLNPQAEKIFGYQRKNVRGQPLERVLIGSDSLLLVLDKIRTQPELPEPQNVHIFRRSGQSFLARIATNPVMDDGHLAAIVFFIQDLTMQELAREQTQLLEQRAILGEITAIFAHEVRNPINNISTGLELVAMNLSAEDPNQPILNRMLQDCDRLNELVKSVLASARPAEYTLTRLMLEPFLQSLLDRFKPRLERANVQGALQIEAGLPPIFANPRGLEQVISNLIVNAIQAMSETGGQVVLNARRHQDDQSTNPKDYQGYIEVNVIDTGPGIPADVQERIFQAFYTTNSSGTGLGLAIAKRIITAHRGNISVKSFPGGTVFTILLPAITEEQAKDEK